jgi:hypothetical protein
MEQGMKLADLMADCTLVPDHLKKKPGDCFPILVQALRWRMDPFAVAQATAVVRGKLAYEGKLVHAVLISMGAIEGRLSFEWDGQGQSRKITVTGTPKGGKPCSISGTVSNWQTANENWKKDPDMMLAYRGTRAWARLYCPDAMLGVYTPDELEETPTKDVTGSATIVASPTPARVDPTEQVKQPEEKQTEQKPAAQAQHPSQSAAVALWHDLEAKQKGLGSKIMSRLAVIYGVKAPKEIPAEQLVRFGADVTELANATSIEAMEELLTEWEAGASAAAESKEAQP